MNSIDQALAQQIVNTIKDVCGLNINFINPNGIILASTDEQRIGAYHEIGQKAAETGNIIEADSDYDFIGTQKGINLPIRHNYNIIAVIGISGEPEFARKYAYLAERITRLLIRERELNIFSRNQEDKKHFVIHALTAKETVNQPYLNDCLAEFHVNLKSKKRFVLIRTNNRYNPINMPMIDHKVANLFGTLSEDLFTFNYPNEYMAVIDAEKYTCSSFLLQKFASDYKEILKVAIGKEVSLSHLKDSYHSALIAMKSITTGNSFAFYDDLVLEIILYNITGENKSEFLQKTIAALDESELELLRTYLEEEGMSLSATSDRLFLHKNTIQYKLNRIFEKTGLNPRQFQDAVLLYLALRILK